MGVFKRDPKPDTSTPPMKPQRPTKANKDDKANDAPSTLPQRRRDK